MTTLTQRQFITFGKPDIGEEEKLAVLEVLTSGWLSTGSTCRRFEVEFQKFMGSGYAVAVSSCSDGLTLALLASKVGPGDEVITTPLTFAATVNAILAVGATPVFADVNSSGNINPREIEKAITSKTKVILPVHYRGLSCDMSAIMRIANLKNIKVIEDAAHAFDGFYVERGGMRRRIGTIGDFTCFSFYPTKNITCGEGGMVMARKQEDAEAVRTLSMQGLSADAHNRYGSGPLKHYAVVKIGRKSNLSDVHAAIGLAQLRRWPELKAKRESIWVVYEEEFGRSESGHAKHLYTIDTSLRTSLRAHLYRNGIGTGIHFHPLHLEPAYEFLGYGRGDFPAAERIGLRTLSLPVSATMAPEDAEYVAKLITQYRGI